MTSTDPLWLPTLSYDETEFRKMDSALLMTDGTALGSRPGMRPGDPGLTVTLSGTTVNVSAGTASLYRSGQGVYRAQLAATSPGTLTAANATFARIDLVYLRVWDTAVDSTGLRKADTVYLAGTASASPAAPSPGATEIYIPLATINVPNTAGGGTGSATVSSAVRQVTVAPGGVLPVSSAVDIALPGSYTGQVRYNTVRGFLETWNGTTWVADGDYTAYTPTWSGLTAMGASTFAGRYTRDGHRVTAHMSLVWGTGSTMGTGAISVTVPFAASSSAAVAIGDGYYVDPGVAFKPLKAVLSPSGTAVSVFGIQQSNLAFANPGGLYGWAATAEMRLEIIYEAA